MMMGSRLETSWTSTQFNQLTHSEFQQIKATSQQNFNLAFNQ
jgi:hypothetical protein